MCDGTNVMLHRQCFVVRRGERWYGELYFLQWRTKVDRKQAEDNSDDGFKNV